MYGRERVIEFTVSAKDFKKAIRQILSGRAEYMNHDTADVSVRGDDLHLCSTGTSTHLPAKVLQAGCARLPLPVLKNVKRAAATFHQSNLRIRIEPGRFRVESFGFSHPDVELKPIAGRIAGLAIDAKPLDVLALQKLYSAEEVAESGLAARVLDAQEKVVSAIDSAASTLREYGVPREAVRELVDAHISLHAKAMRATIANASEQG